MCAYGNSERLHELTTTSTTLYDVDLTRHPRRSDLSIMKTIVAVLVCLSLARCAFSASGCPPDKPYTSCFTPPCSVTTCPSHPTARCVDDYCGGCFARYIFEGKQINCYSKDK